MNEQPAYLVFDIETVADGRLIQRVHYPDEPELNPQETIERFRQKRLEETGSDFIPHTFQVPVSVAIAKCAQDCSLQDVISLDRPQFRPQVITKNFWQGLQHYGWPDMVTFNGRGFDVPVLELCAFRYGLSIPGWIKEKVKNWENRRNRFYDGQGAHIDLQEFYSNSGAVRMHGGLNLLATILGKPGKLDTKGDMVQDLYNAGEHERIDDYCLCDVFDTYFVFLRSRVLLGQISIGREQELVQQAYEKIQQMAQENQALKGYADAFNHWQPYGDDDSPYVREED